MSLSLPDSIPSQKSFYPGIRRAPPRGFGLNRDQTKTALKNALRYIPQHLHEEIAPEFLKELVTLRANLWLPVPAGRTAQGQVMEDYPGKIIEAKAFQVMIDNNLDFEVALYPYELVTYGESGQVFQNWMQYNLVKMYLEEMKKPDPGHLFGTPARPVPIASGRPARDIDQRHAGRGITTTWTVSSRGIMGVSNYGQMTAGGWMYIGPQGIVHGTYITLLNAGGSYLGIPPRRNLAGSRLSQLGSGRHERGPGQGGRNRRRNRNASPKSTNRAFEPGTSRAGYREYHPISMKSPVGSKSTGNRKSPSPSPTAAMSWICGNTF